MTLQLRDYQSESVEAVFDYWSNEPGNPLVDLATGTGKSLVMAELIRRIIDGWPDMRVLVATHVAELIEQDYQELLAIWPFAPAGIYSAGLGRRDAHQQIIFAGIQTVHNKAARIGHIDVLMIDEAHLVPANAETMYGRFIAALRTINPDMKVLGLTATPFRLDSGRLDEGDDRLFDKVVYEYGIGQGIAEGFLAPLSSKPTATAFDLSGVGRQGGDYKQGALQAAVDTDDVT
jgi:DNA repair protein RadD